MLEQCPTAGIDTPSLHDALPISARLTKALVYDQQSAANLFARQSSNEDVGEFLMAITPRPGHSLTDLEAAADAVIRSEEHTSELQSLRHLVCRLLLEKKKRQFE